MDPLTIAVEVNGDTFTYPSSQLEWENDVVISVDTLIDTLVDSTGVDTTFDTTYVEHTADRIRFFLTTWTAMDTVWMRLVRIDDTPDYGSSNTLQDNPINGFYFYLDYAGPTATLVSPRPVSGRPLRTSCSDLSFVFDLQDPNGIDPSSITVQFRGAVLDLDSPLLTSTPIWDYASTYWHIFVPDTFFRVIWPDRDFYWRSVCVIDTFYVNTITTATGTIEDTIFFVRPLTDVDGWWKDYETVINNRDRTVATSAEISESLYTSTTFDRYAHIRLAVVWDTTTGLDFNEFFSILGVMHYPYRNYDTVGCAYGDDDMTDDSITVDFVSLRPENITYLYDTVVATYDEIADVARHIYCEYGWGYYSGTFDYAWEYPSPLHPILTTTTGLARVGEEVVLTPNPPIYEGETLHVELLTATDVFGNPLSDHDVAWDVTADRSAPYFVDHTPAHNAFVYDTLQPITITLGDEYGVINPFTIRVGIDYSGGTYTIDSLPFPLPIDGAYDWTWDYSTGTGVFTFYPERAGIHWAQNDTVRVTFFDIQDSIDICEPNHYAYEYDPVTWTFFVVGGPYVQSVTPANGTYTACPDQKVTFTIYDPDGIDPTSVEFMFEGKVYTTSTVETSYVYHWMYTGDDSVLMSIDTIPYFPLRNISDGYFEFTPPAGTYYDGRQIDCTILNAEDIHGNPLLYIGDYSWHFFVDFTGPVYYDPQPAPGTYASGSHMVVSIAIDDSISGEIATEYVALSVGGVHYSPVTDPTCTWDGHRLTLDLGAAGVTFADGDTVEACLENLYDGVDYYCDLYPNPAEGMPYCWSFVIDNSAPTVTLLEPLDGSITACANQPIRMLVEDNLGVDPSTIELIVEGVVYTIDDPELELVGDTLVFTPDVPYVDGEVVDFTLAQIGDVAGNVVTSGFASSLPRDVEFTVDLTPPEVVAVLPEPGEVVTTPLEQMRFEISDEAGIAESTLVFTITVMTDAETTVYTYPYDDTSGIWDVIEVTPTDYLVMIDLSLTDVFFPSRGADIAVTLAVQDAPDHSCFTDDHIGNETDYEFTFSITPGWRVPLMMVPVVMDFDSLGDTVYTTGDTGILIMGAVYGATDSFDPGIDVVAPPLPPDTGGMPVVPPSFLLDTIRLTEDYKSLESTEPVWMIWTGTTAGTLYWDTTALPEYGAFVINGYLDMRSTDHYVYSAAEAIFINFTPEFITLHAGWNLVSVPVDPADPSPENVFHVPASQIFWYNPWSMSYENPTEIRPGYGYFVLYLPDSTDPEEITFSVPGTPVYEYTINAPLGWVTIGSVYDFGGVDWTTDHVTTIPAGALWGVYKYNPATGVYEYAPSIKAGEGYWAYLTLPVGYSSVEINVRASWLRGVDYTDPLTATDKATLTIGGEKFVLALQDNATAGLDKSLDWLLPPAMVGHSHTGYLVIDGVPAMRDVRPAEGWTLVLTKDATVTTDRPIYANGTLIEDSAELKVGTYKVTFAKSAVPKRLALYQNMPNPFNPVTDIKFDLPEKAKVRLEVYNMLGQKIRTLVDGELEPGTHTVRWDGKDQMGRDAASGVYFYKLTADGKTFTRKMMLLR